MDDIACRGRWKGRGEGFPDRRDLKAPARSNPVKSCSLVLNLLCFGSNDAENFMTFDDVTKQIQTCAQKMNDRYGQPVFDEWAIISLARQKARILSYTGPRNDDFLKHFVDDLGTLRAELMNAKYSVGDFEFARHGVGTGIEAFMVLGDGLYLICNNTKASMNEITKNPQWINAQVPFAELSDKIRSSPLASPV
jgi:hypothetical protein